MNDYQIATMYAEAQTRLRNLHKSGISWSHMGAEIGMSPTSVKNFATGATQRPQFRTVVLLSDYAGFRTSIQHISNLSGEVLPLRRIK